MKGVVRRTSGVTGDSRKAEALITGKMRHCHGLSARVSDNIVAPRTQAYPEAEGIVSIRRDIFQIEQQFSCGPEWPPDSAHGSRRLS